MARTGSYNNQISLQGYGLSTINDRDNNQISLQRSGGTSVTDQNIVDVINDIVRRQAGTYQMEHEATFLIMDRQPISPARIENIVLNYLPTPHALMRLPQICRKCKLLKIRRVMYVFQYFPLYTICGACGHGAKFNSYMDKFQVASTHLNEHCVRAVQKENICYCSDYARRVFWI